MNKFSPDFEIGGSKPENTTNDMNPFVEMFRIEQSTVIQ